MALVLFAWKDVALTPWQLDVVIQNLLALWQAHGRIVLIFQQERLYYNFLQDYDLNKVSNPQTNQYLVLLPNHLPHLDHYLALGDIFLQTHHFVLDLKHFEQPIFDCI